MQIITRKEAYDAGFKRYYTGKPCKNGHDSMRYVTSGSCIQCTNLQYKVTTITPRQQAVQNGEKYYVTGKACVNGHHGLRYTKNGACLECLGHDVTNAHQITPRQQAVNTGDLYYHTGKPCKNGHNSPRYTSTANCVQCAEQVKLARQQAKERQQQAARAQAAQHGDRYYNSGQRCPQGHKGVRYVPTDECVECIAPAMTHDQLARYNLARHTLKPTAVDLQDAQLQQRLCPPSEYNYWRKIITLIKRKVSQ